MPTLPETSPRPALGCPHFPARFQALIFRNWGIVPCARIARALGCSLAEARAAAEALGLDPTVDAAPCWDARGYQTIIRNNWHLCPFDQLLQLLDMPEERLAFLLKEDDFLWHKLGMLKPLCERVRYRALAPEEAARTRAIAQTVRALRTRENGFDFVAALSGPAQPVSREADDGRLRTVYSYFALYGDPLSDPSLDPFPDALLAEYARMGVRGVWLQGILYQLTPFPFDPALSTGWEARIAALNRLIARAKRHGIGVYLYLNEPRSMPDAFFARYPHLRGAREGDFCAMCTSTDEVRAYLEDAAYRLFCAAPDLAGFFTISMSENLTNCYSRAQDAGGCPRCSVRQPWDVVAEVNNLLARGAHRANPAARAIAWSWAWGDWGREIVARLTEGQIVQCTAEEALTTFVGGVEGSVLDYTLSQTGPGETAKALWRAVRARGLETCAKVQINNTWELAAVPWLPVFDKVEALLANLEKEGVRHLQLSWTLGGYPSPTLRFACMGGRDARAFLRDWLGQTAGEMAYAAQKRMSEAFGEFPFHISVAYHAPQNFGPMAPFYAEKTGWNATMVGFPYDDLDGWRGIYPLEVLEAQFGKLVQGWRAGVELLEGGKGSSADFDDMARVAEAALCHFESAYNHIRFVRARNADDVAGMRAAIASEKDAVRRLLALRARDSRLGYEASNHYFYTVNDLIEKCLQLDWLEGKMEEQTHGE